MSRRNGDRARFQRQRQARLLRRKRTAELKERLKLARTAVNSDAVAPVE